jgi:ATP-dependent helicase/nuclease subunit A
MNDGSRSTIDAATRRDEEARGIVRSHLDENIMVLAGAGAGKTHEMITRMVNLVRSGVSVDRMAAITFTTKAAGEMQGRFFDRLQSAADEAPPEERENLRHARRRIDRCYIGTIHSFCGRLLRERSLEAGLPPDFSEIDEREETELRKSAWQRYLQTCDPDDLAELEDIGVRPEELTDFFGDLCQFEDVELYRPTVEKPDLRAPVQRVINFIERVERHLPAHAIHKDGYDDCQKAVRESRRFLEYHGLQTDGDRARLLRKFEGLASYSESEEKWTNDLTYNRWGPSGSDENEFAKTVGKEWLPDLIENVLAPALEDWEAYVYDRAAAFTEPAVELYREMRLEVGKLSFQDLLVRARDLLRDRPEVRAFFQQRYRYLFVDEFQDTDPIQAEILFYLTDDHHLEEKDWTKLTPRPGSLFLVGDGKQSIYRFRRADYETFNLVRRQIKASDAGRIITLQRCFRTYENLCGYVNDTFPEMFERHDRPYQAPFQKLLRVEDKTDAHTDCRIRRITVPYQFRNSSQQIASYDAKRIARFIAAAVREGKVPEKGELGEGEEKGEIGVVGCGVHRTRKTGGSEAGVSKQVVYGKG